MRGLRIGMWQVIALLAWPAAAPAAMPRPDDDPFYVAPAGFAEAAPGTVLRSREIDVTAFGFPLPIQGWQIVYTTRDTHDAPEAAVATILEPQEAAPAGGRPLVAYQPAEDSLTRDCSSSYEISKGDMPELPQALMPLLRDGVAVVVPDYEGPESQWVAGIQSGHAVLDAIRASQRFAPAGLNSKTKVGMWGYSGGGIATSWAAELQPAYAPELDVVGSATGGGMGQIRTTIAYLDGTPYAGILLAATVGIGRAFPEMKLDEILNDAGKAMKEKVGDQCIEDFAGEYPGAHLDDFTTVPSGKDVPSVAAVLKRNDLGRRTPTAPLYVYHSTMDELQPVAGVDHLVANYCARGVRVQYNRAAAGEHIEFSIRGSADAAAYLADRFAGKTPIPNTCDPVTKPPPQDNGGESTDKHPPCRSKRVIVAHPRIPRDLRVDRVDVVVAGRITKTFHHRVKQVRISMVGRRRGTVHVDLRTVGRRGGRRLIVHDRRVYHLCRPGPGG